MDGLNIHTSTSRPIQTSSKPRHEVKSSKDKTHTTRYSDGVLDHASRHIQISSLVDISERIEAKRNQSS